MTKSITTAEFKVMEALWGSREALAAADIADVVAPETGWSLKTIKTLLSRLTEKGAVSHQKDGRRFLYRPVITRKSYASTATRGLADKLFGGRAAPLVAHLADAQELDADDIAELEALVQELKNDQQ